MDAYNRILGLMKDFERNFEKKIRIEVYPGGQCDVAIFDNEYNEEDFYSLKNIEDACDYLVKEFSM